VAILVKTSELMSNFVMRCVFWALPAAGLSAISFAGPNNALIGSIKQKVQWFFMLELAKGYRCHP